MLLAQHAHYSSVVAESTKVDAGLVAVGLAARDSTRQQERVAPASSNRGSGNGSWGTRCCG